MLSAVSRMRSGTNRQCCGERITVEKDRQGSGSESYCCREWNDAGPPPPTSKTYVAVVSKNTNELVLPPSSVATRLRAVVQVRKRPGCAPN